MPKFNFKFFQNFGFSFRRQFSNFFNQDSMYFDAGFGNGFSISIFIWVQNFTMVQKLKNSKLQVKIVKSRVQNFAFLDTFGRFASPRPNALSQSHQILHTGWQVPGASSCKISAHKSNFKWIFWPKKAKKRPKNAQNLVFWLKLPNYESQ